MGITELLLLRLIERKIAEAEAVTHKPRAARKSKHSKSKVGS